MEAASIMASPGVNEAGHARRRHELAELSFLFTCGAACQLAAHAVCGVWLLKHPKSSLTRRDDANVLVKGGSGHAITAGYVCHLNVWIAQQGFYLSHLLVV